MYISIKRLLDILLASLALLLMIPFFLLLAFLIKIDSQGPVFYMAERIGRNRKLFKMFKFRTMKANADKQGPWYTQDRDERITRMGAWLRKYSVDELPQIINVVIGDMSLVGPRPDAPQQKNDYTPGEFLLRTSVHPGITGLAQAEGRSSLTVEQRKELDLLYAKKASLFMDILILYKTFKNVVKGKDTN